jgi:hypothetical protein
MTQYPPSIAVVGLSARLTLVQSLAMVDAVASQVIEDFSPAWGLVPKVPALYTRVADVPAGMPLILLLDVGTVPDAAGWHTEDLDGRISGVVVVGQLLDVGWSLFEGESIQACLSHECLEAILDPTVNEWIDMPDGSQDSKEVCDRVQANTYTKGSGSLSNFLLPHAWDSTPPAGVKFDWLGVLKEPFEIAPGGYASRRDPTGKPVQVGLMPEARRHALGRSARRATL